MNVGKKITFSYTKKQNGTEKKQNITAKFNNNRDYVGPIGNVQIGANTHMFIKKQNAKAIHQKMQTCNQIHKHGLLTLTMTFNLK